MRLRTVYDSVGSPSNPAARLMVIRMGGDSYKLKPTAPTRKNIARWAENGGAIVDYMKANHVRVVNMSWGGNLQLIEEALEANDVGKTTEERRKVATELLAIEEKALTDAFRDAPEILLVASADNSDVDISFARAVPADIVPPNLLTVGAVDQAGDEASFTSYGKQVRVYASGHQVESLMPGGSKARYSGASMAAPQVTNLAAKLFALDPKLTPTEVIQLIIDGSTKTADGKRLLINPKASVALLEAKR